MTTIQLSLTDFTLVGKLENFITKSKNTIKYLELITEQGRLQIKVTKELNNQLQRFQKQIQPGCKVKIKGKRKQQLQKGTVKYKGYQLELIENQQNKTESFQAAKSQAKVLFCQKSTCWKKGGKVACEALKAELKSRGLEDQITIQTTGCLKQCKKAPNMVLMPDKARYSKIESQQIADIIEKHLIAK